MTGMFGHTHIISFGTFPPCGGGVEKCGVQGCLPEEIWRDQYLPIPQVCFFV